MARASGAPGALFCDTNVLVRLLTGEPPAQALAAERALDRAAEAAAPVILTDVVAAELAYVLTAFYELAAGEAADRIRRILDLPGIEAADPDLLFQTLEIWTARRLDFADAHLAALDKTTRGTGVLSFDRDLDRIEGVTRIDPSSLRAP